jgi:hypothetical protein
VWQQEGHGRRRTRQEKGRVGYGEQRSRARAEDSKMRADQGTKRRAGQDQGRAKGELGKSRAARGERNKSRARTEQG